ncbi:MAG TPA: hypothetical protein VF571_17385 [Pyrinomonadaceae bacterium]|jgi:hypothetical protein
MSREINKDNACHFRDEFRYARAVALKDAEGYQEILFALERLGSFLKEEVAVLGRYKDEIKVLAGFSPLSFDCNKVWHSDFTSLYELVKTARNDALHQGAIARHLTESAVKLALIIEDAIEEKAELMEVKDYMVRNPVCADKWQPLSYIRQQMLINSFSFLPFFQEAEWHFVSDCNLAKYLNSPCNCEKKKCDCRKVRLAQSLFDAINKGLVPESSQTVNYSYSINQVLTEFNGKPILVFDNKLPNVLLGIITSFDIL